MKENKPELSVSSGPAVLPQELFHVSPVFIIRASLNSCPADLHLNDESLCRRFVVSEVACHMFPLVSASMFHSFPVIDIQTRR